MHCAACDKQPKKESTRLPRGWKRHNEQVYCAACWQGKYMLRAVIMRVVSPVDLTWPELRDVLKAQWIEMTRLANWCTTECYVRDVRRNGEAKMPPSKLPYLYPEARTLFPAIPSQAVASGLQNYQAKYRAARYQVIWTGASVLPTYRYPQPAVAHNATWTAEIGEDNRPYVSLRLGEARVKLRLMGGSRYRRQLASFRQIASGEAVQGELQIYRRRTAGQNGDGKDRNQTQRRGYEILVKMVAWLPKTAARERNGTLCVRTDSDSLLIALDAKDQRLWIVHADHARRYVVEHSRRLQRLADDQKAEQRPVPSFADRRGDYVRKFRDRMHSVVRETAQQLVNFADRRHFAEIRYDDTDQRFLDRFPYHELRSRIETVCQERSILFTPVAASAAVTDQPQEVLADEDS
jgi:hypothetical protein